MDRHGPGGSDRCDPAGDGGKGEDRAVDAQGLPPVRTQQPPQAVLIAAVGSQQHREDQHRRRKGRARADEHQLPPGLHGVKALLHIVPAGILYHEGVAVFVQHRLEFRQKVLIIRPRHLEGEGVGLGHSSRRPFLRRYEDVAVGEIERIDGPAGGLGVDAHDLIFFIGSICKGRIRVALISGFPALGELHAADAPDGVAAVGQGQADGVAHAQPVPLGQTVADDADPFAHVRRGQHPALVGLGLALGKEGDHPHILGPANGGGVPVPQLPLQHPIQPGGLQEILYVAFRVHALGDQDIAVFLPDAGAAAVSLIPAAYILRGIDHGILIGGHTVLAVIDIVSDQEKPLSHLELGLRAHAPYRQGHGILGKIRVAPHPVHMDPVIVHGDLVVIAPFVVHDGFHRGLQIIVGASADGHHGVVDFRDRSGFLCMGSEVITQQRRLDPAAVDPGDGFRIAEPLHQPLRQLLQESRAADLRHRHPGQRGQIPGIPVSIPVHDLSVRPDHRTHIGVGVDGVVQYDAVEMELPPEDQRRRQDQRQQQRIQHRLHRPA